MHPLAETDILSNVSGSCVSPKIENLPEPQTEYKFLDLPEYMKFDLWERERVACLPMPPVTTMVGLSLYQARLMAVSI